MQTVIVPEGHAIIAQRFSVGNCSQTSRVPKGRPMDVSVSRPFGTRPAFHVNPNAEALGYFQASLRDDILVALGWKRYATVFTPEAT